MEYSDEEHARDAVLHPYIDSFPGVAEALNNLILPYSSTVITGDSLAGVCQKLGLSGVHAYSLERVDAMLSGDLTAYR